MHQKPIMVVGVGNSIQMDDGAGIHALRELEKYDIPEEVELFDGGTLGIDLMPYIEGREKLIFIDSVKGGQKPGTLFRFEPDDLTYDDAPKTSVHQIGLIESLQMISMIGKAPDKIVIFGSQPGIIDWGETLTNEVKSAVQKLLPHVIKEIEESVREIKNKILEEENG
jgi:hydrogenase maturation protease